MNNIYDMGKELVYNNIFIPVRFIKKEAYVNLEDHKNIINKREKVIDELEKENKLLEYAIKELMAQCDVKYFRFRDKEFYKQEFILNLNSKKK